MALYMLVTALYLMSARSVFLGGQNGYFIPEYAAHFVSLLLALSDVFFPTLYICCTR